METTTTSIEQLQHLLEQERVARKAAENQLAQKELEWAAHSHIEKGNNELALKEQEDKQRGERLFRDVVNNLPGIVFQIQKNEEGLFVYNFVSPVLHQMLGIQVTNTSQILPFIHPDDRIRWTNSLITTYDKVRVWKQEIRFLMPDGTIYWWISSATPSYSPSGDLLYNGILLNITKQKQAELSLQESERKWRFALEGSGDGLWEHDVATNTTYYSAIFKQMLGYGEAEYANAPSFWKKTIHPDDVPKVEAMESGYESGLSESHSIQYRARKKDGEYIWIMDRGFVLARDSGGKPSRYIGVHTNITKIKQTEIELASTATKLTTLITNMQDGIMLEDEHNVVILCNQAFCDIFDIPVSPKDLIGDNIEEALVRNTHQFPDFDGYVLRRHSLLQFCQPASNEEIELNSGKYLSRDYAPLIIDGECKGHLWKYSDITQRKKAEKDLIAAEKQYRSLIENMQVGLIEIDNNEKILYANQTYYDMCGYTEQELSGNISAQLSVDTSGISAKKQQRLQGIGEFYEVEIRTKTGQVRWWYVSAIPKRNDNSEVIGTVAACLDITDQKTLEIELRKAKLAAEESSNAKDIFLANMSHEIRTPMNAVFGMTRLMEKTNLQPQQRFYLETISNSTASLMVIVNDILDFSKISVGKLTLEKIGFRLQDIISASIDVVAYKAREKGLQLLVNNAQCSNAVLLGDPFRLKQVFMNLLTNAVKFTSKGSVSVNCTNNGIENGRRHLTIQVKDTGRGMEEGFLKILFEKFTQEDESIARSYSGTGLGMSISKHLVELMGGNITVQSTKNVGTVFSLDFYFEEGNEEDLLIEEGTQADISLLQAKHILLVEDNEMNQLVAQTVLEQNGMKVTVAVNGVEAVSFVQDINFDLILMDMQMPVMDGLQATSIIRKTHTIIPIIALTANALKGERDKCLAAGMNDFLAKPFEEKVLLSLLCKWLDKREVGSPVAGPSPMAFRSPSIATAANLSSESQTELYDLAQLRAISPGNTDFLKMLIKMFMDDAVSTVAKMGEAIKASDFKLIKSLAHRIKPSIDQLSIPYTVEIRRIEELCVAEDTTGELEKLITGFGTTIKQVIKLLEKEL